MPETKNSSTDKAELLSPLELARKNILESRTELEVLLQEGKEPVQESLDALVNKINNAIEGQVGATMGDVKRGDFLKLLSLTNSNRDRNPLRRVYAKVAAAYVNFIDAGKAMPEKDLTVD